MDNQILTSLKETVNNLTAFEGSEGETQRNVLKEELQFFILNFIYHHPEYSRWVMYGGSALRICHGLNRMSVDLDFEINHPISGLFLNELKKEVETYFRDTYNTQPEFLTIKLITNKGLRLCFHIGGELGIRHPSNQIHVKIDLNNFVAPKTVVERIPMNQNQFSFVIKTYNMSALMASKIAAVLLRGQRGGVGGVLYQEKGRDIYDLLWYMGKKAIPDLDYLQAKGINVKDLRMLFDTLTVQMNKVNDINLKQDLTPLFTNQTFIEDWLKNWRETYFRLFKEYNIRTVTTFEGVNIFQNFHNDTFSFLFRYKTDDGQPVSIAYAIIDYWVEDREGELSLAVDEKLKNVIEFTSNGASSRPASREKLMQYATLFYQKTENYFKKGNNTIFGDMISTKLIRMTANNLNHKEQIVLNRSALLSCELEDLLK